MGERAETAVHARPAAAPLARVGIQVSALDVHLLHYLARLLKDRHGSAVHLYARSPTEARGLARRDRDGLWDSIETSERLIPALGVPIREPDAVVARARAWEARIGETFGRLSHEHRQLGRGFAPLGAGYPVSPVVARASYPQMLHAFNEALDFWAREIEQKRLSLVLNAEVWASCVCRAMGVAYRRLCFAGYENYQYWATDEYFTNPHLEAVYRRLTRWQPAALTGPYDAQAAKTVRIMKGLSFTKALSRAPIQIAKRAARRRNGPLLDPLRGPFRRRKALRAYQKLARTRLTDLAGRPFVYYPLHKEPETAFTVRTPEYLSQHAAILSLARHLPAGALLAVKEHLPALGFRPPGFFRQLTDLKAVVLVDIFESSIAIIREAAAVATILGTAGLEATVLGRPVINFGRHNPNRFVPHVATVTDETQLKGYLTRALDGGIDAETARSDGARFLEALKQSCFDMGGYGAVNDATWGATREGAETLYDGLLASFEPASAA